MGESSGLFYPVFEPTCAFLAQVARDIAIFYMLQWVLFGFPESTQWWKIFLLFYRNSLKNPFSGVLEHFMFSDQLDRSWNKDFRKLAANIASYTDKRSLQRVNLLEARFMAFGGIPRKQELKRFSEFFADRRENSSFY